MPSPPLITNPSVADSLSIAALKRNLAAHATFNDSIVATGTKKEMMARLKAILLVRQMDLIVKEMLCGDETIELEEKDGECTVESEETEGEEGV
jgi:hypothetical protein